MLEVEMKYAEADLRVVKAGLALWKARPQRPRRETDRYFNAPDRDFARTDEALRLRQAGRLNILTYKGPKLDALSKTRSEIEAPLADGSRAAERIVRLLAALGYRPVATVVKRRQVYRVERERFDLEISLDEVEELGRFVELEIQAAEVHMNAARDVLLRAAGELGLGRPERRSYLELLLLKRTGGA